MKKYRTYSIYCHGVSALSKGKPKHKHTSDRTVCIFFVAYM